METSPPTSPETPSDYDDYDLPPRAPKRNKGAPSLYINRVFDPELGDFLSGECVDDVIDNNSSNDSDDEDDNDEEDNDDEDDDDEDDNEKNVA